MFDALGIQAFDESRINLRIKVLHKKGIFLRNHKAFNFKRVITLIDCRVDHRLRIHPGCENLIDSGNGIVFDICNHRIPGFKIIFWKAGLPHSSLNAAFSNVCLFNPLSSCQMLTVVVIEIPAGILEVQILNLDPAGGGPCFLISLRLFFADKIIGSGIFKKCFSKFFYGMSLVNSFGLCFSFSHTLVNRLSPGKIRRRKSGLIDESLFKKTHKNPFIKESAKMISGNIKIQHKLSRALICSQLIAGNHDCFYFLRVFKSLMPKNGRLPGH